MANVLRRDIAVGETVIDEYGAKWIISSGFGLSDSARGCAVYAKCEDGREGRIEDIIDSKKTNDYNKQNVITV